jgi:RimJ/RimL family protein N-acetyltransferase
MKLVSVYDNFNAPRYLYDLLGERTPAQSISHKAMPSWEEHCEFVASRPYLFWYLIEVDGYVRGACYLSKQREIGVFIFKGQHGHHYGLDAVALLVKMHPGRFLANINPGNVYSAQLFESLGFVHVQDTYELVA